MTPVIAQGLPRLPGPTGYTDDSLASDLRSRSAAGTDLEWVMTRFRLDLVTVNSISKLSVKDNFDLARQSKHSFAPTISKAMLAVTNLSSTHGRSRQGLSQQPRSVDLRLRLECGRFSSGPLGENPWGTTEPEDGGRGSMEQVRPDLDDDPAEQQRTGWTRSRSCSTTQEAMPSL